MATEEKRLIAVFERLGREEQASVLAFAEFLAARNPAPEVGTPQQIPRPEKESVIGAVKRLSATYPMLDKSKMLHETSALVTQHLMQGRLAAEVINELELVFQRHYERLSSRNDNE